MAIRAERSEKLLVFVTTASRHNPLALRRSRKRLFAYVTHSAKEELFSPAQFPNCILFKCVIESAQNASRKCERLPNTLIEEPMGPALLKIATDETLSENAISLSSAYNLAVAILSCSAAFEISRARLLSLLLLRKHA